eukprot:g2537.t1
MLDRKDANQVALAVGVGAAVGALGFALGVAWQNKRTERQKAEAGPAPAGSVKTVDGGGRVRPFGTWDSPVSGESLISDSVTFGTVMMDNDTVYWTEMRPKEAGRYALCAYSPEKV